MNQELRELLADCTDEQRALWEKHADDPRGWLLDEIDTRHAMAVISLQACFRMLQLDRAMLGAMEPSDAEAAAIISQRIAALDGFLWRIPHYAQWVYELLADPDRPAAAFRKDLEDFVVTGDYGEPDDDEEEETAREAAD